MKTPETPETSGSSTLDAPRTTDRTQGPEFGLGPDPTDHEGSQDAVTL